MSFSRSSSNIIHHVCSTVNSAIAWNALSPKAASVAFFAAAQALAFYIFATVDEFSFPITTRYLSLRGRFFLLYPDFVSGFMHDNAGIEAIEEVLFNGLLRIELAVDDKIRGNRDRSQRHNSFHDPPLNYDSLLRDLVPCPCSGHPRLGILSCYPLLIMLIKPTLQLGYRICNTIIHCNIFTPELNPHYRLLYHPLQNLAHILGRGYVEDSPRHGATLEGVPYFVMWRYAGRRRLFFRLGGVEPHRHRLLRISYPTPTMAELAADGAP